jgi:hypothetical protein
MEFIEYIINNYNLFVNVIIEINNITTDILNKYGGF